MTDETASHMIRLPWSKGNPHGKSSSPSPSSAEFSHGLLDFCTDGDERLLWVNSGCLTLAIRP